MRTAAAAGFAFAALFPFEVHALTAGDFLDRLNADQRSAFIDGALEMLAHELSQAGQGDNAACVIRWYYEGEGPRQVAMVFSNHRDLPAVAILKTLAKRVCS